MKRRRLILACTAITLAACSSTDSTAPRAITTATASHAYGGDWHDGTPVPGSVGEAQNSSSSNQQPLACNVDAPLQGSAIIGPSGGTLNVGPHRLIIPPGALDSNVTVSGVVPAGNTLRIDFYPQGLQFRKPAGLVLDASSCGTVPNVIYLDEVDGLQEHIQATFSTWWHTIAAPLDHFSGYLLDV
ncbi:MAG TPA: hypothetical protein VN706_20430 [Gemmatimonadaceae bacterium]|nr:hypothetical protein [Gemmatimonadaceae bacterium]